MFNKQKRYFKQKLDGVQKMIWDLEFKRQKTRMIREEIRVEYDQLKSKLEVIQTQIKAQLKNPNKICEVHNPEKGQEPKHKDHGKCACEYIEKHMEIGEIERLYDQKVLLSRDLERFLSQIKQLDVEVEGSRPTSEYPDGVQGISQQLDGLRELQGMLSSYIKGL